jgi:curved DNA-binding protein CbpA
MKVFLPFIFIISCALAAADEADHAIFKLTDSIKKLIDEKGDFYSVLGVARDADDKTINSRYRKQSLKYHPDKNPSKEAAEIYKILTSVAATLKDPKLREKYDKHLERGIPVWRGTDYYQAIFEPGLMFLFWFIMIFASIAQYIIRWIMYYREKSEADRIQSELNSKSYAQVKKELKKKQKKGIIEGQKLSKSEFENANVAELLGEDVPNVQKPLILDLLIFAIPVSIYKAIIRVVTKNKKD